MAGSRASTVTERIRTSCAPTTDTKVVSLPAVTELALDQSGKESTPSDPCMQFAEHMWIMRTIKGGHSRNVESRRRVMLNPALLR